MRVTQKQIAAELGVSISLVSRVLSNSANAIGIPQHTIDEVKRTADQMGYYPNPAAQALKGKPTKYIGIVVYDFKDPFFSELVAVIQDRFHRLGYSTVLVGFTDRQISEKDLSPLKQHILDSVLILGSDLSGAFHQGFRKTPIFRIGHTTEHEQSISFYPDENEAAQTLAEHLRPMKLKNATIIRADLPNHTLRADAMKTAMENQGIQVRVGEIPNKDQFSAGREFARQQIGGPHSFPDIFVCTTDLIAIGAMKACLESKLSLPEQIKVTGFDDIRMSAQFHPPLTTFRQPISSIVDQITERLSTGDFTLGKKQVKCPLIQRTSC